MKKILLVIFLLIFIQRESVLASNDVASSSSQTRQLNVSYDLPYPGILPDNPLYILKTLRDKMVSSLINDSLKKAEFDLLTSDKRLNAGYFLVNKGRSDLAIDSISKSNNYFFEAINMLVESKKQGKPTDSLAGRAKLAVKKHEEVLKSLERKIDSKYRGQLAYEYQRLVGFESSISPILPK